MTFPKKLQKFVKPLDSHVKGFHWPETECQLKPNLAKWGGSEVDGIHFFSLNRGWACWLPLVSMPDSKRKVKKIAKLELQCKVQCILQKIMIFLFNVLTQIFGLFSSKHYITTREELSPQHSQRVGSSRQFQSWWTNSIKPPFISMGTSYFDASTPVFIMHTDDPCFTYVIGEKHYYLKRGTTHSGVGKSLSIDNWQFSLHL